MPAWSRENCREVLKACTLFDALPPEEIDNLAGRVQTVPLAPEELLFREGDPGRNLFVVAEGAALVFTVNVRGEEVPLERVGRGGFVGEQAMLPEGSGKRNASVRAAAGAGNVTLLEMAEADFQAVLHQNASLLTLLTERGRRQLQERVALQSRLVQALNDKPSEPDEDDAKPWLRSQIWKDGDVVVREGEPGDRFYFISEGLARVTRATPNGEVTLMQLGPRQFFGERALLKSEPRAATVRAAGTLHTISLSGKRFLELYDSSPQLRDIIEQREGFYALPVGNGMVTLQEGQFDGRKCLTAIRHLPTGVRVISTKVIGASVFSISRAGNLDLQTQSSTADIGSTRLRYEQPDAEIYRELYLDEDNSLLAVTAWGEWPELGEVYQWTVEGRVLDARQIEMFRSSGTLGLQRQQPEESDADMICACMQVIRGTLRNLLVSSRCRTADDLIEATGASRVCGACAPLLQQMAGNPELEPVVARAFRVAQDVTAFRLYPRSGGKVRAAQPGQYIVIEAQIDNRWVQRAYALSSPGNQEDYYEIVVKREPLGLFSRWLCDEPIKQVDAPLDRNSPRLIKMSDPRGEFLPPTHSPQPLVFLAGGIGIAPALSLVRTLLRAKESGQTNNAGVAGHIHIDYTASRRDKLICVDELTRAVTQMPERLSLRVRVSGEEGRVQPAEVETLARQYPNADFYICVPQGYQIWLREQLAQWGIAPERVHVEEFTRVGGKS